MDVRSSTANRVFISGALGLLVHEMIPVEKGRILTCPRPTKYKKLENQSGYKVYVGFVTKEI